MMRSNSRIRFSGNRRRGSVLIYSFFMMAVMMGFISLGVDFGRMETVKTEAQRDADATARAALELYQVYGSSVAVAYAPYIASNSYNPVDSKSGVTPTVSIIWGSWNAKTNTFTAGGTTPIAVQVTISRTAQTGNAVPLTFPLMNGLTAVRKTCDVWARAIAVLNGSGNQGVTVTGQGDPWLAGMPSGSPAVSDGDTAPAQSPPMVMNVVPGTVLTFTNVSGGVKNDPSLLNDTADGDATQLHSHNDDDPLNEPAVQNDIGNIISPINAMVGVFLTDNAPNTQPAPTVTRDYSTQAARDQQTFSDIQLQQPFFVGDGQTSGGTVQTFVVPQGATRLYLGTMDGHQWNNNSGSYSVTINQQQNILLVK